MRKKITIVIPAYNAELTIEECMNSIISQTYENIEIIVVNDGSTDNTKALVEKYVKIDDRVKLLNQINSGVSEARNNGLKKASGDFIVFVDCDDWLEQNMIELMIDCQTKYNVDVVRCNYFYDKIDGTKIANVYDLANKRICSMDIDKVREHFLLAHEPIKNLVMLLLIKKEILIKNGIVFNKDLYMMEDVLYYQQLFSSIESIYFMETPLYHYFENPNSVTNSSSKFERMIYGIISTNKVLKKFLLDDELLTNKYDLLNANHVRIIIFYLYNIYVSFGRKDLIKLLNDLYNNDDFLKLLKNCNLKHISTQFRLLFKALINKKYIALCILFEIKKLKERL